MTSKRNGVPIWMELGFLALPLPVINMVLRRLALRIVQDHPEPLDRMSSHVTARFLIDPTDLPIQFRIQLDSPTPVSCRRRTPACDWDARIAGPIAALFAMVHGALDGDALFFSRKITVEGDTDAILAMRNAIDAAEINIPYELANLCGPLSPLTVRAAQILMPVLERLSDIAAFRRGVQTA